jgi:hypothetical protein
VTLATRDARQPTSGADSFVDESSIEGRLQARAIVLLSGALFLLLAQAFIPTEEFIHRADDSFYYFGVAANFPEVGYWTFDSLHSTNGVQPLWAVLLTGVAQVLGWVGVEDPGVLARVFVGIAAVLHFGSAVLLFHILRRKVSVGTAIAAAGAFLFPLGIVWARVRGMENSLYAFTLLATIAYFHFRFLARPTIKQAGVLGILLGLTALSRLNAALFAVCLLMYYLLRGSHGPLRQRLRLGAVASAVTIAVTLPYFAINYATTEHLLPISGVVKSVAAEDFREEHGIESRLSTNYVAALVDQAEVPLKKFASSRAADGLWVVGGRLVFDGAVRLAVLVPILFLFLLVPLAAGRPREWLAFLLGRFRRLGPFGYVLAFGVLDAAVSIWLYPTELPYAMVQWWFVPNEIIIIVLVAILVAACVSYLARRLLPSRFHVAAATAGLALLVVLHAQQMVRFYWDDKIQYPDWHLSWNDESLRAAEWLSANVPEDSIVGSWNAGVLGYYADQRVVNLDGLINDFDLVPYLENERIDEYIVNERIAYLSDMEGLFERHELRDRLPLTLVYSHYSEFAKRTYVIYRVDGFQTASSARGSPAGAMPVKSG